MSNAFTKLSQDKLNAAVAGLLCPRIEAILGPVVGNSNVHAQVTAQIDFANKEQTEEQYSPNGDAAQAVMRSRQINSNEQVGGAYPGGVPGALSNQPAPANAAPISTPPANQQNGQQNNQHQTAKSRSICPIQKFFQINLRCQKLPDICFFSLASASPEKSHRNKLPAIMQDTVL